MAPRSDGSHGVPQRWASSVSEPPSSGPLTRPGRMVAVPVSPRPAPSAVHGAAEEERLEVVDRVGRRAAQLRHHRPVQGGQAGAR